LKSSAGIVFHLGSNLTALLVHLINNPAMTPFKRSLV